MPQRRQKTPKTASVAATRRSHHAASSSPPATAWPSTAAMTGLRSSIRVGPTGPSPSGSTRVKRDGSPLRMAFRSAPAQNVPFAPHSTATASASSSSKRRKHATSASAVGRSTALATSGRSIVTTATGPSVSYSTLIRSARDVHGPVLEALDARRGRVDQLMRQVGERPCRGELLADDRDVRIAARALRAAPAVEARVAELQDGVGAGAIIVLGEADAHLPRGLEAHDVLLVRVCSDGRPLRVV